MTCNTRTMRHLLLAALACLVVSACAHAQTATFTLTGGFSNIEMNGRDGNGLYAGRSMRPRLLAEPAAPTPTFYAHRGGYVDGAMMWHVPDDNQLPLVVGAGVSVSGTIASRYGVGGNDSGYRPYYLESDLGFLSLETRAAMPFRLSAGSEGFFVTPGVGAGLLINHYELQDLEHSNATGGPVRHTSYHTGSAFDLRPGIQTGYAWSWGSLALDVSYMASYGAFGRLGQIGQELRIGLSCNIQL